MRLFTHLKLKAAQRSLMMLCMSLFFLAAFSASSFAQATLETNKDDYHPGELLILGGTGWQPGETVILHMDETPARCANGHNYTVVADDNGDILFNTFQFNQYHLGVSFHVVGTGQTSGYTAEVNFTDGPGTEPATHNLAAGNFSFTGFADGTTTTYPTSMQGYYFAAEAGPATVLAEAGDFPMVASTGLITTGSIRNEIANGISLLNSGSNNIGAIVVALNTTGRTNITVGFIAQQLNSGGSGSTDRISGLRLQYRVGNSGNFTDVASSTYLGTNTTSQNPATTFSNIALPAAANNNSVVYLRWIYYVASGTANARDRIRLDEISVTSSAAPTNVGLNESYAIVNFGAADVYYDLKAATSNPDFNNANLGTFNSTQSLYLDGAQNKVYKCTGGDITGGTLFYRVYLVGSTAPAFSSTSIGFLSGSNNGCGGQDQTWENSSAGINLLGTRCDGEYYVEVYTTASSNSGTLTADNNGSYFKAKYTINNSANSGIYESYIVLKKNSNANTYYDLNASTSNPDFTAGLGSFCSNETLTLVGGENKVFKCGANNVTNGTLYYRIYPAGSPTGSYNTVNLATVNDIGGAGAGCQNQQWFTLSNTTNILNGLAAGNYTIEVYSQADYNIGAGGTCGSMYASNNGNNYKANFTVLAPVNFTTKPPSTVTATATANCSASVAYTFVIAGSATISTSHVFSGATSGSGSGTGSGKTFNVGITTVLVTGVNSCGETSYSFNVDVQDNTAPTAVAQNVTVQLDASGNATLSAAQVNNGSTDNCAIESIEVSPNTFNCANLQGTPVTDLFISEYVEGSGNNKAIEIFNGTNAAINLSGYSLRLYANGSSTATSTVTLSGSVAAGGTFVIANPSSSSAILAIANQTNANISFNGNDAVALVKTAGTVDVFGRIGQDPGAAWTSGSNTTVDATLRRRPSVHTGVSSNPAGTFATLGSEWDVYPVDNIANLGSHSINNDIPVTLTVTDQSGNSATARAYVTVVDNLAPVAPALPNVTGQCSATAAAPTATDNCSGTITGTTTGPTTFNTQGTHTITWTFTDASGNSSTATQSVVIADVTAPVAPTLATVTGQCSASASTPTAQDNCAGTVQGVANGPTSFSTQGTYTIVWTFNDGNGNTSTATQTVIVADVTAPVAPTLATVTGQCSASASTPTAQDNCAGTVQGVTNGPTSFNTQGAHTIVWTFNDGNGNTSTATQTVIVADVTAPVAPTLATVTGECSAGVTTAPTAQDNCAGTVTGTTSGPTTFNTQGTHTIVWTFNDGNGNTSTATQTVIVADVTAPVAPTLSTITGQCSASAPAPTAQDNCAGTVTGTTSGPTTFNTQGTHTIVWTFNDGNGNTSTATQTVIVADVTAPVAPTLATVTGQCSASASTPTAQDNCAGTVTGTPNGPTSFNTQGTHTIVWTFNDGNGNTSTATQTVIVADVTAPVAPTLATVTGECSAGVTTAPTAQDNCAGTVQGVANGPTSFSTQGTHTIVWTFNDGNGNTSTATQTVIVADVTAPVAPTLATVTGECSAGVTTAPTAQDNCAGTVTGTTSGPTTFNTQGTHTIVWTFNDGNGNTSTATQTVVVDDVTAPVAPTLATVTGQCSASAPTPTAQDNCVGTVQGVANGPTSFNTQGTHTIVWTFNDGNGNTSTATQTVIVADVTAPVAPTLAMVTGQCSASAPTPTAQDNCAGTVQGIANGPTTFNAQGTYTIVWTFNDGNGNSSTATQTVIVADVTAPVAPTLATVTGQCSASVTTAPTAQDNCAGTITGTANGPTSFNTQGTHTIVWTFNDGNGNTSTATQQVIVNDNIAPTIASMPNIVLSACQSTATWSAPSASDNCAGYIVAQTAGPAPGSTFANGTTTTITYRVTDVNGNTASTSFTVTRKASLVANCSSNNSTLYYGYSSDQSAIVSVNVAGGAGPYTIVATMNRALKCNVVNTAGDELWTASGATSLNNVCPGTGTNTVAPTSTFTGVGAGSYSVNVTLMADAVITFTITDANGCVTTCSQVIHAEDVRCFAGNSGNAKVTICHQTGSVKNPCTKICVDESALAEHLAHGDYVGNCTPNCVAPANNLVASNGQDEIRLELQVIPNPTPDFFNIYLKSPSNEPVIIRVMDMFGRTVMNNNVAPNSRVKFGHNLAGGTYFVQAIQGKVKLVQKVIKVN